MEFVRPESPAREYRDDDGVLIPYGSRWGLGSPAEDSYSRTSNLDRFAALHTIADALIAWLVETYDAVAADDTASGALLYPQQKDIVRTVRVSAAGTAPLLFTYTGFPGMLVHAGAFTGARIPICGCDACDESGKTVADEMERFVSAVVRGGLTERLTTPGNYWCHIEYDNGTSTGEAELPHEPMDFLPAPPVDGSAWPAWQKRS